MARPEQYTHGLALQLGFMPAGFFPIGSWESLTALVQDYLKTNPAVTEATLYTLNSTPAFTTPTIDDESIAQKFSRVVAGEDEIKISTTDILTRATPLTTQLGSLLSAAKTVFPVANEQGAQGMPDFMKVAQILVSGQQAVLGTVAAIEKMAGDIGESFWNVKTDDYIRNEHGVFVSGAWLESKANTSLVGNINFKAKPAAPGAAPA